MSSLVTENWESGRVHFADSGDMVRSKQERLVANLLTSKGISFEYERKLSSWDGSFRYPDFTLFINGEQYYWEHWGWLMITLTGKTLPRGSDGIVSMATMTT